jgi:hypothetical protein
VTDIWVEHELDLHVVGDLVGNSVVKHGRISLVVANYTVAPLGTAFQKNVHFWRDAHFKFLG